MSEPRGLFRKEAVERLLRGREDAVLPRLARPRVFRFLWAGTLLAGVAGALAASARLPEYAAGEGVLVADGAGAALVVLLPHEAHPRLRAGQTALVRTGAAPAVRTTVARVEEQVLGPEAVAARFGPSVAARAQAPAAVALLRPFSPPEGLRPDQAAGSVHAVRVQVGTARVFSLAAEGSRP